MIKALRYPSALQYQYRLTSKVLRERINSNVTRTARWLTTEPPPPKGMFPQAPITWRSAGILAVLGSAVLFYFKVEYDEKMKKSNNIGNL